jgi:Tol biopolymer transport system component
VVARNVRARGVAVVFPLFALAALGWITASIAGDDATSGGRIAFLRNGRVYFVNADGSGQRKADVPAIPYYSPDGRKIAFYTGGNGTRATRLYVENADGGGRHEIARLSPYDTCLDPVWSPDGKKLAYTLDCDLDFMSILVVNRDGTGRRRLTPGNWALDPAWSPSGRMILFTSNPGKGHAAWRLFLIDPAGRKRHRIRGSYPEPDLSRLGYGPGAEWSRDGKRIFFLSYHSLHVMNASGTNVRDLTPNDMTMGDFELSPDGRTIAAVGATRGAREIYVLNADGSGLRQLTHNRVHDRYPSWSPDGRRIVFTSERDGNSEIYVMNADGSDQTNISQNPARDEFPTWVPPRR